MSIELRRINWGWFGEPWPSGVCYADDGRLLEEMRVETPVGEACLYCGEVIVEGDRGQRMPCFGGPPSVAPIHRECQLRSVVGGVGHLDGMCSCLGNENRDSGMTTREEALAVWRSYTS